MSRARDVNELNEVYNTYLECRDILREFYFSPQRAKQKRRYELQKRRYIDRLCSAERWYAASDVKGVRPIMFVGDRGLSIGSRIKGFMRYGGHWKPKNHSLYTAVCITNEHNTSQTCLYCFNKLSYPVRTIHRNGASQLRTINGAFACDNPSCVSVQAKKKSSEKAGHCVRNGNRPVRSGNTPFWCNLPTI